MMEQATAFRVSQRVLDYTRAAFREEVEGLLDDPSDLLHPWRDAEPAEVIAAMRSLGNELGLDFDALVAGGHPAERERMADIEDGTLKPLPREPAPAPVPAATPSAARPDREGRVALPFWTTAAAKKQLRLSAAEGDVTQQELLNQALNLLFVKLGKPPLAR